MKQMTAVRMALCSLFTALIAIGAFLQIPLPNFDYFTLQFFFVLMAVCFWERAWGLFPLPCMC